MACAAAACEDLLRLRLRPALLRSCGVRTSTGNADGPSAKQWLTRHRHLPKRSSPLRHLPARCRMLASKPSHQSAIYPVQLDGPAARAPIGFTIAGARTISHPLRTKIFCINLLRLRLRPALLRFLRRANIYWERGRPVRKAMAHKTPTSTEKVIVPKIFASKMPHACKQALASICDIPCAARAGQRPALP